MVCDIDVYVECGIDVYVECGMWYVIMMCYVECGIDVCSMWYVLPSPPCLVAFTAAMIFSWVAMVGILSTTCRIACDKTCFVHLA